MLNYFFRAKHFIVVFILSIFIVSRIAESWSGFLFIKNSLITDNYIFIDTMSLSISLFTVLTAVPCFFLFKGVFFYYKNISYFMYAFIVLCIVLLSVTNNVLVFFFFMSFCYFSLFLLYGYLAQTLGQRKLPFIFCFEPSLGRFWFLWVF